MNKTFDIDALRAVVAGIELGSFSRAATQLCRSQSAISMQLRKLEQQAGVTLFVRKGRTLVPTEAGELLAEYARQIIALNDEATLALGAKVSPVKARFGLPQDFFDDVLPATLKRFSQEQPNVHVETQAGLNYRLPDKIESGELDAAITFFEEGSTDEGELLGTLPMHWLAHKDLPDEVIEKNQLPLVLYDHPCLFRQLALKALDQQAKRYQFTLTTPSLPGIWGALRAHVGISVRAMHNKPDDIMIIDHKSLPVLPNIELRLLRSKNASNIAQDLQQILKQETLKQLSSA